MGVVIRGVRLEAQTRNFPARAEFLHQHRGIKRAVEEATIEAVSSLEGLRRTIDTESRKARGLDRGFGRPAGLKTLDRAAGAVGFQRPAGEADRDPYRVRYSAGIQSESRAATAAPATTPQIADAS